MQGTRWEEAPRREERESDPSPRRRTMKSSTLMKTSFDFIIRKMQIWWGFRFGMDLALFAIILRYTSSRPSHL